MRLYQALNGTNEHKHIPQEGPALCGFKCGNRYQSGCLTEDQTVRLHSCERGTSCTKLEESDIVWITPIITRAMDGSNIQELGAGGGGGDLLETHELDLNDAIATMELIKLCSKRIADPKARSKTLSLIADAVTSSDKVVLLDSTELAERLEDMPLADVAILLQHIAERGSSSAGRPDNLSFQLQESKISTRSHSKELAQGLSRHIVSFSGALLYKYLYKLTL